MHHYDAHDEIFKTRPHSDIFRYFFVWNIFFYYEAGTLFKVQEKIIPPFKKISTITLAPKDCLYSPKKVNLFVPSKIICSSLCTSHVYLIFYLNNIYFAAQKTILSFLNQFLPCARNVQFLIFLSDMRPNRCKDTFNNLVCYGKKVKHTKKFLSFSSMHNNVHHEIFCEYICACARIIVKVMCAQKHVL